MTITYSECASVALVIEHAKRMRVVVICDPSGFITVFHIISETARFQKEKLIEHKISILVFSTRFF
jgi:hypothetical protein